MSSIILNECFWCFGSVPKSAGLCQLHFSLFSSNSEILRQVEKEIGDTPHTVRFTLPMCPPSVNSLYILNFKPGIPKRDRARLKPDCIAWKNGGWMESYGYFNGVKTFIPPFKIALDSLVRVDRVYSYPFLQKTGLWKKSNGLWDWQKQQEIIAQGLLASYIEQELIRFMERDSFNMDKLLFDAISEKLSMDPRGSDRRFKEGLMRSVNSPTEQTVVVLTELTIAEWSRDA
jgi:hypothetical protein